MVLARWRVVHKVAIDRWRVVTFPRAVRNGRDNQFKPNYRCMKIEGCEVIVAWWRIVWKVEGNKKIVMR